MPRGGAARCGRCSQRQVEDARPRHATAARCEALLRARDKAQPLARRGRGPDGAALLAGAHLGGDGARRSSACVRPRRRARRAAAGDGAIAQLLAPRARSVTCLDRSERVIAAGARAPRGACRTCASCVGDLHALPFARRALRSRAPVQRAHLRARAGARARRGGARAAAGRRARARHARRARARRRHRRATATSQPASRPPR